MLRPVPSSEQEQLLRLLDTRIALVLASQPHGARLRHQMRALRDRMAVEPPDRRTLADVAAVIDSLAPRRTIDGEPMTRRISAAAEHAGPRWPRRAATCAAGLAGLVVLFV